jgi:hypothetical protein
MKFGMNIAMDNAAFEDPAELPRILHDLARLYEANALGCAQKPGSTRSLFDSNGNRIGEAKITK